MRGGDYRHVFLACVAHAWPGMSQSLEVSFLFAPMKIVQTIQIAILWSTSGLHAAVNRDYGCYLLKA